MGEIASPSQLRMSFLRWAIVTIPLILLLGIGSGRLSGSGYDNPWFAALSKPEAIPPAWSFGLVWTLLYIALGLALAIVLHARRARGRGLAITLFVVQFALNLAWSPVFFGAHEVNTALWLIFAITALAAVTAVLFWRIRKGAGLLMAPYVAWLIYASFLNYQIDRLNPDADLLAPGAASTQITL